jgi:aspartate carbamoyltransferase catalytic subunit
MDVQVGPHLLGIKGLTREQVELFLHTAEEFSEINERAIKKVPTLRGRTVINLFLEASTRTRSSFEIAAKRLSADAINVGAKDSSVSKGESLIDTVYTLQSMKPEIIVMRHESSGAPHFIAEHMKHSVVVNAGDGLHEHPTQALLDALSIRQRLGRLEGLTVTFVGDYLRARAARSLTLLLQLYGAKVRAVAPPTLLPPELKQMGVETTSNLKEGLEGADVIYSLRMKLEYLKDHFVPDLDEYSRYFILSEPLIKKLCPNAILLAPGPFYRGIELTSELVDGPRSLVSSQVTNGVNVRMAVLYLLATQHAHRFVKNPEYLGELEA